MFEFDATIRAMGLYKYLITIEERLRVMWYIKYNKDKAHEHAKSQHYYLGNVHVWAEKLKRNHFGERYDLQDESPSYRQ